MSIVKRAFLTVFILSILWAGLWWGYGRESFGALKGWLYPVLERPAIMETIALYNKIFTDLYVSDGDPLRLDDFPASKQMRHELYKNIGFLRDNNLWLVYDMADLAFKDVKLTSPRTAEAVTYEEWNYVYWDTRTMRPVHEPKGMGAGFKYLLVKDKSGWIVVDCVPADVEHEQK